MSDVIDRLRLDTVPFGYEHHEVVPAEPGLYSFWLRERCLYVGMSDNLKRRIREHESNETNTDLAGYFDEFHDQIKISVVPMRGDLRRMESEAIRDLHPVTNADLGGAS